MSLLLAASGCHSASREKITASDVWERTYTVEKGADVSITNRAGAIEIQGVDGSTVEVRAERVVHAGTDKIARDVVSKVEIVEEVQPGRLAIRTKGVEGVVIGVDMEVTYHVKVPTSANVRAQTASGDITVSDVAGRLSVNGTNGNITASKLGGGIEIRSVNGKVEADARALGVDPVSIRTTNGTITLTVPAAGNASLQAQAVNGTIALDGLAFESTDPGPERGRVRRTRGRLNAGGTLIDLQTVNGNISIAAGKP